MGFGKKDIVKNISSKAHISLETSSLFLEAFLSFVKQNKKHQIKISKFGNFYSHTSPARLGRNPKTKEEFKIPVLEKLGFKASKKVRSLFN